MTMNHDRSSLSINELIRHITGILLKEPDIDSGINQSLRIIREVTRVDRVYIFELWTDPKLGLLANQIYEHCAPGVHAEIDNPDLQGVIMSPYFDRWVSTFQRNSWISGHIEEFPKIERDLLDPQGIKSILIIPIRVENQLVGFMGFDSTTVKRTWMLPEVELLIESSVLIGTLLLRRDQEARLKAEDSKYMDLFQNMSDGVVYHDAQGAIKNANKAACEILGLSRDELMNRGATDIEWNFLHENNEPFEIDDLPFMSVIKTGKPVKDVVLGIYSKAVNRHRWLSVSATPENNGKNRKKVTGVYTIFRDISERIEYERQLIEAKKATEEVSRLKTNIISNIDHEFRTPLTGILGFSSIIAKDTEEPSTRDSVRFIETSARRLQNTLESLLEFAHYDVNSIEFRPKYILVSLVLNPIIESFRGQATTKGLGFKYSYSGSDYVYCDERFLRSIIRHLLSNAIKFTEQGSIRVQASRSAPHRLQIRVSDTGIGMTMHQLQIVFSAFEQADSGTSRKYGGTGLGLHISYQLAELMQGELSVSSEPGQGSEFTLELPLIEPEEPPMHSYPVPKVAAVDLPLLQGQVLVVDDVADIRLLVVDLLQQSGLTVTEAVNGAEAIECARKQSFDLILMDMNMPVLDGAEATRQLRAAGFSLPILALTADVLAEDQVSFLQAGCNEVLSKPIEPALLYQALARYLARPSVPVASPPTEAAATVGSVSERIAALKQRYLTQLPAQLEQLRLLLTQQDQVGLEALLHQIKGTAGSFGLQQIAALAAGMELKLKSGQPIAEADCSELAAAIQAAESESP